MDVFNHMSGDLIKSKIAGDDGGCHFVMMAGGVAWPLLGTVGVNGIKF